MKQSKDNKYIPMTSVSSGSGKEVRPDVYYYTNQIVNVIMLGKPGFDWVLIDAGMPHCGKEIIKVAEKRFGKGSKPVAIFLSHGHFDHVGSIVELIREWQVPVFAHPNEFPFLTGKQSYPAPDTSVEGGLLAKISFIYPHEPIDISEVLLPFPNDCSLPFLTEWRWIAAPGHSPGQVAFFRESDRTLISADAFITVKQDSLYKVLIQKEEINGPPVYLTTDWHAAKDAVIKLESLSPELVISGHGQYMEGERLKNELRGLATHFDELAIPAHGAFVDESDKDKELNQDSQNEP